MSSFMDFFQDFIQKKESNDGRRTSTISLPEEEACDTSQIAEVTTESVKKMEHSYNRDNTVKPIIDVSTGLPPVRTILVRKTPQCPSCHVHPIEDHDLNDGNQAIVPSFNEIAAKEAMNECARIAKYVKNVNPDDEDWETRISQSGWSPSQKALYDKVVKILDSDYLGRLANLGRQNEVIQRRILIDRSAQRLRKVLISINWESRLTQWLHCLLMDYLPATYMASYLDILQTLKSKVPTLVDKMLFMRPLNSSQELLAPVMKKHWEPTINTKARILPQKVIFVAIPSLPFGSIPRRLQRWYQNFASIGPIIQVTLPSSSGQMLHQPLEQVAEQIVSLTRVKIQELRHEDNSRGIVLIGFGAGSSFALQVAMSESVASVVCLGFSYNTINGPRGNPDDRILDIKVPILFVIGQNSQRTSSEEIEALRERLQSESSMVLVGCADDFLRVPKSRRKLENVTQSMVDSMIVDEVYEFIKKILTNPPGPRTPTSFTNLTFTKQNKISIGSDSKVTIQRKRKNDGTIDSDLVAKGKFTPHIGRPRTRPFVNTTSLGSKPKITSVVTSTGGQQQNKVENDINEALKSILQDGSDDIETISGSNSDETNDNSQKKIVTNFDLIPQPKSNTIKTTIINAGVATGTKIHMIPPNQFVQLKPTSIQAPKFVTIKSATPSTTLGGIKSTIPVSSGQQQIFTLKSPSGQTTQFVTAAPASAPQKYTVVKNASGGTTLQLTKNSVEPSPPTNVDLSNIIDMPIVFADSDGNIADAVPATHHAIQPVSDAPKTTNLGQLIINQKIIRDSNTGTGTTTDVSRSSGTIVFSKPPIGSTSTIINPNFSKQGNKVLYINRNTMKPCPNIIRPNINQKFSNVVVTNPKLSGGATIIPRNSMIISTTSAPTLTPVNNSVVSTVKPTIQTIKSSGLTTISRPTSGILNVSTKTLPQVQIINAPSATSGSSATTITPAGDKPQIRNIVLKGGQLLNRNVTVRKLVNIVPISRPASATGNITITQGPVANQMIDQTTSTSLVGTTTVASIQTTPKILTLTPTVPSPSQCSASVPTINISGDSE